MLGVLIGSFCSFLYRGIDIVYYNTTRIVLGSWKRTLRRIIRNLAVLILLSLAGRPLMGLAVEGYVQWFICEVIVALAAMIVFVAVNAVLEREEFRILINRIKKSVGRHQAAKTEEK